MNYPEELRERYNEVMYDERDIIEKFLKDQYDIRYGRQRDTWHFKSAVKVLSHYGSVEYVTDIMLDKDRFVIFILNDHREYECFDFAYGELSKVIEALPDADEIVRNNALCDLLEMDNNLRLDLLLDESPFVYENGGSAVYLRGIPYEGKYDWEQLGVTNGTDFLVKLRDHIHIEHLHRTKEYKEVMERLSLLENMRLEFDSPNVVMFDIKSTDMKVDILSVQRDDTRLSMSVMCVDDGEVLTLEEKDVFKEYLYDLAKWMKMWVSKYSDIMDTHNAHNPELVRKINTAWKSDEYHDRFGDILFALGCRDEQEIQDKFDIIIDCNETAMDNAHEIMEGVCDDQDLECILKFIRYE